MADVTVGVKYARGVAGQVRNIDSIKRSTGTAQANQIISTESTGTIHETLLPDLYIEHLRMQVVAGVALTGDINAVYLTYNDTETRNEVLPARANSETTVARGVVIGNATAGDTVTFYWAGFVDLSSVSSHGFSQNVALYLSPDTAGSLVNTTTDDDNELTQRVGFVRGTKFELAFTGNPILNQG